LIFAPDRDSPVAACHHSYNHHGKRHDMPSYELLDTIADAYVPALALISLLCIVAGTWKFRWKIGLERLLGFAAVAVIAYGLMFLDLRFGLWPALGLDYSTHTAVSLGLAIFLCFHARRLRWLWLGSLLCYVALMLYQRYHTVPDIISTAVVAGVPIAAAVAGLRRWLQGPRKS
jgi:hypothetical protein